MSRKTRPETSNAFSRMTAALKLPPAAYAAPATAEPPRPEPVSNATAGRMPATRINTKIVAGHFSESTHRALRIAGAEEGLTMQQILEEALHDWLVKKGATKHLNK